MPNVYVILGDANTRKSFTARALTGVAQRKAVTVAMSIGDIDVFVQISSLQESKIMPADFIAEIVAGDYQNVLVTLWVSQRVTLDGVYPAGVNYLGAFLAAGWTIEQIIVLGTPTFAGVAAGMPPPQFVPDSRTTPVNLIASHVRGWWGWL